jgi:hypothetical protein
VTTVHFTWPGAGVSLLAALAPLQQADARVARLVLIAGVAADAEPQAIAGLGTVAAERFVLVFVGSGVFSHGVLLA